MPRCPALVWGNHSTGLVARKGEGGEGEVGKREIGEGEVGKGEIEEGEVG